MEQSFSEPRLKVRFVGSFSFLFFLFYLFSFSLKIYESTLWAKKLLVPRG